MAHCPGNDSENSNSETNCPLLWMIGSNSPDPKSYRRIFHMRERQSFLPKEKKPKDPNCK